MSSGTTTGRQRMIRDLRQRGIGDPRVLEAMGEVLRERFVEEALAGKAYSDVSLPIGNKQTISQPMIVARMCELAGPDGDGKVLEIGTGSGYHAAVLAHLFRRIYSVERLPELSARARRTLRELQIENVHFKIFDGSYGWSEFAPYCAIVVTAAVPEIPQPLLEQLEENGRLVAPIGDAAGRDEQTLIRLTRRGETFEREEHGACRFVPLVGRYGWNP